jgi:hypothetical protein
VAATVGSDRQGADVRSGVVGFGLVTVVAMTVLAGCSSTTGGSASPSSGAASSPAGSSGSSSPAGDGAPKVTNPIDISKWAQNPCSVLTPTQLTSIGVTGQGKSATFGALGPGTLGPDCTWTLRQGDHLTSWAVYFGTNSKVRGLNYYYDNGAPKPLPDIDGQPAIIGSNVAELQDCTVAVGASDTTFFAGRVIGAPQGTDPCSVATQIATDMTTNMKSGG